MMMAALSAGLMNNNNNNNNNNNKAHLDNYDIAGIVVYFIIVVGVGILSMCTSKRNTVSGYFLANKETKWFIVGASLFASNIGTEHFVGLAGSGAAVGISVGAFEISGLVALQLLGWVFLPVYIASKAYTLPEYIQKRFGGSRIRIYLALMSLTIYIFTKISVAIYSGILFVNQSLEWNKWFAIMLLLGMTAISSFTGGLAAAIYTEVLQAVSILLGAFAIFIIALIRVGGYTNLVQEYPLAVANFSLPVNGVNCNHPLPDAFVMLREVDDPNVPWLAFLLGQTTVSIWYWAADQMMVQRALSAKSLSHAQGGALLAGYFKFIFFFVMILPGMIGRVLWPNEIGCATPNNCEAICGNRRGCTDIVYPKLVMEMLPSGVRGLMLAVMLSALVSDLLSIFNSASALFTIDIWSKLRRSAKSKEILIVGRLFNILLLLVSILWFPFIQQLQGGQLFFYIKAIASYLSPPIAAIFILAMFWRRCSESGAFFGLLSGLLVGAVRAVLDFAFPSPECGTVDVRPMIVKHVHFMYFAFILFAFTVGIAVLVSICTEAPTQQKLIRTTFATRFDQTIRPDDFKYDRRRSRLASVNSPIAITQLELERMELVGMELERMELKGMELERMELEGMEFGRMELERMELEKLVENGGVDKFDFTINTLQPDVLKFEKNERAEVDTPVSAEKVCTMSKLAWHARKIVDCCCGFSQLTTEEKDAHDAHLVKVSSLDQDPRAKLFLNLNLGILLTLVVFVLIFFSTPLHDLVVLP